MKIINLVAKSIMKYMSNFVKVLLPLCLVFMAANLVKAQTYNLTYGEHQFIPTPDAPYDGWIESAYWITTSNYISFADKDDVGATVYPNRYFEGYASVTCTYNFSYYGADGRLHAGQLTKTFAITYRDNPASFKDGDYIQIYLGDQYKLEYTLKEHLSKMPEVEWTSRNTNIATVTPNGNPNNLYAYVKAVGVGTTKVVLDPIVSEPIICEVVVSGSRVEPSSIMVSPSDTTILEGKSCYLKYTLYPSDASTTVKWSSSNESVATVSSSGLVKGLTTGSTTITATTSNGLNATAIVKVVPLPQSVSIAGNDFIYEGYTQKYSVSFTPSGSTANIKWSSSNNTVLTVDSAGNVKALKEGTASITVTTSNGKTNSIQITVKPAPASLDARNVRTKRGMIRSLIKR